LGLQTLVCTASNGQGAAMIRRVIVCVMCVVGAASSCGSDSSSGTASPTDTESAVAESTPADSTAAESTATTEGQSGALDCEAVKAARVGVSVNIQLLAQLPGIEDVNAWPTDIGTMSEFGAQLDALAALEPYGDKVAEALDFYRGGNDIAQRGYAGDAAASAELADYLGPNLSAVLSRQASFGMAFDGAGC
jgi:hypothetical protein